MENLNDLIELTVSNLWKIVEIGRKSQAISPETVETITSTIDELGEIKPRKFPLYFCVGCGDDFEQDEESKPLNQHPPHIVEYLSVYGQGANEKDHIPESICQACLEQINIPSTADILQEDL